MRNRSTITLLWIFCLFGGLVLSSGAKADDIAYSLNQGGGFGTVDLDTVSHSSINFQVCPSGAPANCYVGVGVADDLLFTAANTSTGVNLYTVSLTGGGGTLDQSYSGAAVISFGSTTTGMFAIGSNGNLYSVNPTSFAVALIGSTGLASFTYDGLSTNSGTLYFTDNGNLYTLNTLTGAASLVGSMGSTSGLNDIGSMIFENGTLYGTDALGDSQNGEIFKINTSTGAATDTGVDEPPLKAGGSLAPDPLPTPEPSSLLLLGGGLVSLGLGAFWRKRICGEQ